MIWWRWIVMNMAIFVVTLAIAITRWLVPCTWKNWVPHSRPPMKFFYPVEQRLAGCFRDNSLLYFSIKSVLNASLSSLLDSLFETVRENERSWYHIEIRSGINGDCIRNNNWWNEDSKCDTCPPLVQVFILVVFAYYFMQCHSRSHSYKNFKSL